MRLAAIGSLDRDLVSVGLTLCATTVLTLAYTTLGTRLLGPSAAGDFLAVVFLLAFVVQAAGPLGGTASRFAAQYVEHGRLDALSGLSNDLVRLTLRLLLWLAAPVVALGAFGVSVGGAASGALWVLAVAAAVILTFVTLDRGLLRGLSRFSTFNKTLVVESGSRFVFGLALLLLFRSTWAAVGGYVVGAAFALAFTRRRLSVEIGGSAKAIPDRPGSEGELFRFLAPMAVVAAAYGAVQNLDVLIVRHGFPGQAAAYGASAVLAHVATMLVTPFSTTLLPRAAALHGRHGALGREAVVQLLRHASGYVALCVLAAGAFALAGDGLVVGLYGPDFADGGAWLAPLTASIALGGVCLLATQSLAAHGCFGFLAPVLVSCVLGLAAVFGWAATPASVISGLFAVKLVLLALLAWPLSRAYRADRRSTSGPPNAGSPSPDTAIEAGGIGGVER